MATDSEDERGGGSKDLDPVTVDKKSVWKMTGLTKEESTNLKTFKGLMTNRRIRITAIINRFAIDTKMYESLIDIGAQELRGIRNEIQAMTKSLKSLYDEYLEQSSNLREFFLEAMVTKRKGRYEEYENVCKLVEADDNVVAQQYQGLMEGVGTILASLKAKEVPDVPQVTPSTSEVSPITTTPQLRDGAREKT